MRRFFACSLKRRYGSKEYFPHIIGLIKQLKIFLQSVAKKQDVLEFLPTGLGKSLIFQMLRTLNVLRLIVIVIPLVL